MKMEPLFVGLLIALTVCAPSSHTLESSNSQSPLDAARNQSLLSSAPNVLDDKPPPAKEIRLDISLNAEDNEKEAIDADLGK